jgi:hypothetical protein
MMGFLLLGVAALVGGLLFLNWFANTSPQAAKRGLIVAGLVILALVALAVAAIGRAGLLLGLLLFLFPVLARLLRARRAFPGMGGGGGGAGGRAGRQSEVVTDYLRMTLDQQTGEMSGEVLAGRFAGRPLGDLDQADLLLLHEELRQHDRDAMAVLEAYLDRVVGPDWRQAAGSRHENGHQGGQGAAGRRPASGAMARDEALAVLGLKEGATTEEIKTAHRRLMAQVHPDHGGSDYMAAKINEAKDVLLGR